MSFTFCWHATARLLRPAARRRSRLPLTPVQRVDISRGIACGWSIRVIAKGLDRAASTVSREIARHGGRSEYRANEADQQAAQAVPSGHPRQASEDRGE